MRPLGQCANYSWYTIGLLPLNTHKCAPCNYVPNRPTNTMISFRPPYRIRTQYHHRKHTANLEPQCASKTSSSNPKRNVRMHLQSQNTAFEPPYNAMCPQLHTVSSFKFKSSLFPTKLELLFSVKYYFESWNSTMCTVVELQRTFPDR